MSGGALSKEFRDDIQASSSFAHQETFFLWESFVLLADEKTGTLSRADFVSLVVKQRREENSAVDADAASAAAEHIFDALDEEGKNRLSFRTWVQTINRACRGTTRDLAELAAQVLDTGSKNVAAIAERAELFVKLQGMEGDLARPDQLHEEARALLETAWCFKALQSISLEAVCGFLVCVWAPHLRDMEQKLKRFPSLSLPVVCSRQEEPVPTPVAVLCARLEALEEESPKCVSFKAESLHKYRSLVEAVTNAYTHGWTPTEGLEPAVLLMVLRTYLRLFTEPVFTLHVSRQLLSAVPSSSQGRREALRSALQTLPRVNRETIKCVVQCCHKLNYGEHSLDTLTRIVTYCLIRAEAKTSSTSPAAVSLVKVLITDWPHICEKNVITS